MTAAMRSAPPWRIPSATSQPPAAMQTYMSSPLQLQWGQGSRGKSHTERSGGRTKGCLGKGREKGQQVEEKAAESKGGGGGERRGVTAGGAKVDRKRENGQRRVGKGR